MSRKLVLVLLVVSLLALSLVSCAKPLTLNILAPTDGKAFSTPTVEARGSVSDAKASVWVNGVPQVVKKPTRGLPYFSTKIDLVEGENTTRFMAARGYKKGNWKEVVEPAHGPEPIVYRWAAPVARLERL